MQSGDRSAEPRAGGENDRQIVIITGMSGSGKHTAFKALEDLGFFCVDNLPTRLVPRLLQMMLASEDRIKRLAVVVDVRSGDTVEDFRQLFRRLRRLPFSCQVVFLDAVDRVLAQRYSETRRVHPLARDGSLVDGFRRERESMAEIKAMSDWVIDTSDLTPHELRRLIYDRFQTNEFGKFHVSLVSFGYKNGLPYHADLVFDVRFLPNPHFVSELRSKSGEEPEVEEFVLRNSESRETVDRLESLLDFLLPRFQHEGKAYCTIGIGCTGGRHRAVVVARELGRRLARRGYEVSLVHRDVHRDE